MISRSMLYDIIYALAARDGREAALFGNSAQAAHIAFERSLAGNGFPELWFELPLKGDPWFDLHALASPEHLADISEFKPDTCGNCPEAFAWFARQERGVRQLALSWDTSAGDTQSPAVQLLTGTGNVTITCDFLNSVGRPDAAASYRSFAQRIPKGWCACYAGVFPRRTTPHLRVECIPSHKLQRAYANDPSLLEKHLREAGFDAFGETLLTRCQLLAGSPFQFELQFDVQPDGSAGPTLGASIRFPNPPGTPDKPAFDPSGAAGAIFREVEAWGLADGRWHLLAQTSFCKRLAREGETASLFCYPAFLKLRWRDAALLDAKAYLMAGLQ